jgi:predicted heme/steroid binding protein
MELFSFLTIDISSFHVTIIAVVIGILGLVFVIYNVASLQEPEAPKKKDPIKNVFTDDKPAPPRPDFNKLPVMNLEELSKYKSGSKVYVAICDLIYDVSESEAYRPPSSYSVFAGRDASVALAKMNFNEENFKLRWDD